MPVSTEAVPAGTYLDKTMTFAYDSPTDLSVVIIEMTSSQYGDSILIDYGNFEVLIDAGQPADKDYVRSALKKYVTDGVLDMLIVTHPHSDHIGAMTSTSFFTDAAAGVSSISYLLDSGASRSNTLYPKYKSMREDLVTAGTVYYPAYNCFNVESTPNKFVIGNHLELDVLFNEAYDVPETDCSPNSSDYSNQHSVCVLLTYKGSESTDQFFLGGDVNNDTIPNTTITPEESVAESEYNKSLLIDGSKRFYKASHHASATSNYNKILSFFNPDIAFISCSIKTANRTSEGPMVSSQHPYSSAVGRIMKYADKELYWNAMNGTTSVTYAATGAYSLSFAGRTLDYYNSSTKALVSAESEKSLAFPLTQWYKEMIAKDPVSDSDLNK